MRKTYELQNRIINIERVISNNYSKYRKNIFFNYEVGFPTWSIETDIGNIRTDINLIKSDIESIIEKNDILEKALIFLLKEKDPFKFEIGDTVVNKLGDVMYIEKRASFISDDGSLSKCYDLRDEDDNSKHYNEIELTIDKSKDK